MRWDKYLEAAGMSGLMTTILAAAPFFLDGKVTGTEAIMLLGSFLGGAGFYMKEHPMTFAEVEVAVAKAVASELVQDAKVVAVDKVEDAKVVAAAKVEDAKAVAGQKP